MAHDLTLISHYHHAPKYDVVCLIAQGLNAQELVLACSPFRTILVQREKLPSALRRIGAICCIYRSTTVSTVNRILGLVVKQIRRHML